MSLYYAKSHQVRVGIEEGVKVSALGEHQRNPGVALTRPRVHETQTDGCACTTWDGLR